MKSFVLEEERLFQILVSQYRLLDEGVLTTAPAARSVIDETLQRTKSGSNPSVEDIFVLDKALLRFLNKEQLICRFGVVSDMYREIAGDKNYSSRVRINTVDFKDVLEAMLRAQIEELLDDTYLHIVLYAGCRRSRNSILKTVLIPMTFLFAGFITWMGIANGEIPPVVYVIIAGSLGGMVSMIRRIQASSSSDTNLLTYIDLKYDRLTMYLAPVYGAVFSVVLLLFFTSHLLTGDIFPAMETMEPEWAGNAETVAEVMQRFVVNTYPSSGVECAKMILWAFLAGFAERFVPDALDRLVARGSEEKKTAAEKTPTTEPA